MKERGDQPLTGSESNFNKNNGVESVSGLWGVLTVLVSLPAVLNVDPWSGASLLLTTGQYLFFLHGDLGAEAFMLLTLNSSPFTSIPWLSASPKSVSRVSECACTCKSGGCCTEAWGQQGLSVTIRWNFWRQGLSLNREL